MLAGAMGGSVVGGVSAGWFERRLTLGRVLVIAVVASGAALILMGVSSNVVLSISLFATTSLTSMLLSVPVMALLQTRVPDEYMGRALSFLAAVEASAAPISALVGGWLADVWSPATVFIASGAWVIITTVLILTNPQLRSARVDRAVRG